jgi:hypothetical protein
MYGTVARLRGSSGAQAEIAALASELRGVKIPVSTREDRDMRARGHYCRLSIIPMSFLLPNVEQLHIEDQRGIGRDDSSRAS